MCGAGLSCRKFRDNAVRLQLHALAYNLANFMRTLSEGSPNHVRRYYASFSYRAKSWDKVRRVANGSCQQMADAFLKNLVGRQPDRI